MSTTPDSATPLSTPLKNGHSAYPSSTNFSCSSLEHYLRKIAIFYWKLDARCGVHTRILALYALMQQNPTAAVFFTVVLGVCAFPLLGFLGFLVIIFAIHVILFALSLFFFVAFGFGALFLGLVTATVAGFFLAAVFIAIYQISIRLGLMLKQARAYVQLQNSNGNAIFAPTNGSVKKILHDLMTDSHLTINYVLSSDIDCEVPLKICSIENFTNKSAVSLNNEELRADPFISCQIFVYGKPLTVPIWTKYRVLDGNLSWNEWLVLPIRYCEVPREAQLAVTLYGFSSKTCKPVPLAGTTISLFSKNGRFRAGQFDLRMWDGQEADGNISTKTPAKIVIDPSGSENVKFPFSSNRAITADKVETSESDEFTLNRLNKLKNEYEDGRLPTVEWLDRLSLAAVAHKTTKAKESIPCRFLSVEFPRFRSGDTFYDIVYDPAVLSPTPNQSMVVSSVATGNLVASTGSSVKTLQASDSTASGIGGVSGLGASSVIPNYLNNPQLELTRSLALDPDLMQENLIESKHRRLVRSYRASSMDAELKPTSETRDALYRIIGYPPGTKLSSNDKDLVWQYRFYLSKQKKALTKFLSSVNWQSRTESGQALEMLGRWVPVDVEDALELLSPAFTHQTVRRYAVTRLSELSDEDLLTYLLQLVQALRYEDINDIKNAAPGVDSSRNSSARSSSSTMPVESIVADEVVPAEEDDEPPRFVPVSEKAAQVISMQKHKTSMSNTPSSLNPAQTGAGSSNNLDLASFLIQRACSNIVLATYLYWYLAVEQQDVEQQRMQPSAANRVTSPPATAGNAAQSGAGQKQSQIPAENFGVKAAMEDLFALVLERLSLALKSDSSRARIRQQLAAQRHLVDMISGVVREVHSETVYREKKIEILQQRLTAPNFVAFSTGEITLPLDPTVRVCGIEPASASLFKSKLMPSRLTFVTTSLPPQDRYVVIFKDGDDLRQDQLVLQIIQLMDRLLRRENLDLRLTPYKVLATKPKQGFVQFVPAMAVREILAAEGSLLNFLRKHNPNENGPYGIAPEVMDNYIRSCAGYCIITYILGVGDRHFDNLLLTHTGKLFHIDFGYLLGRDPKPLPPPMKLSREMVDAMGGTQSEHFAKFKQLCYTVFLTLRRSSNLLSNLLALMIDANIPDIALEPDKAVRKVAAKFRPELNDEEAVRYLQNLIDDSLSGIVAGVVEAMHTFVQYWKN